MRTGVWLAGARGSVAVTTMVGCLSVRACLAEPIGCVTELAPLHSPALPTFADLIFGGHDVATTPLEKRAHSLVGAGVLPLPLVTAVAAELGEIEARLRPVPAGASQHETAERLVEDLIAFRRDNEFGAGEIDFPPALAVLDEVGYAGLVAVELPRHSHAAPQVAARSLAFLRAADWLARVAGEVAADPTRLATIFPAARRHVGREHADSTRVGLIKALPDPSSYLPELYRYGDNDEKRAVLLALPSVDATGAHTGLVRDALRTNDTRLVAAALGPCAEHLTDDEWRQAVLRCVFMGLSLAGVHRIGQRADAELGRMLDGLRAERCAAGRALPPDAIALLERLI